MPPSQALASHIIHHAVDVATDVAAAASAAAAGAVTSTWRAALATAARAVDVALAVFVDAAVAFHAAQQRVPGSPAAADGDGDGDGSSEGSAGSAGGVLGLVASAALALARAVDAARQVRHILVLHPGALHTTSLNRH